MHFMRYLCAIALVSMLCPASMHCTLEPRPDKTKPEKKIDQQIRLAVAVKATTNTAGSIVETSNTAGEVVNVPSKKHKEEASKNPKGMQAAIINCPPGGPGDWR